MAAFPTRNMVHLVLPTKFVIFEFVPLGVYTVFNEFSDAVDILVVP